MLKIKKHKMLSRLIAFTFAFNAIAPIAFASEEATTTATTTTATASSGLSLNSVSNDILTRMASTASSNFKSRNLNISDSEINTLMSIPLSTSEEESYLTQEEKDYNNLQLLIAQGLNTAEARAKALASLEEIEALSVKDDSVALTNTEKYIKSLLENYDDITSRANISNGISSAITPTDNAMVAYKTILKIAKAERLACRNDATANKAKADKGETLTEGTNTDPDKCELSAKGKEAAQMLTAISNQQVNQTTDAKKTTNATNTSTSSSGERKCESSATPTVAINDNTKCCPTQQPFYNSTTAKCVASLSANNTSSSNNKDDDDDDSNDALLQYLMMQRDKCINYTTPNYTMNNNSLVNPCSISGTPTMKEPTEQPTSSDRKTPESKLGTKNRTMGIPKNKMEKSGTNASNQAIMSRISDVKIEFNENNKDDQGFRVHVNDASSEFKVRVMIEEKPNNSQEKQNPLFVKFYAVQFVGENAKNSSPYKFTQVANNGEFTTIVYPETQRPAQSDSSSHFVKKVLDSDKYYTLAITISDGVNESSPFYEKYKIVDYGTKIVDTAKDQKGIHIESLLNKQGKETDSENVGSASINVSGARYENGICKISGNGYLVPFTADSQKIPVSEYHLSSINEADCAKINEDAKNNDLVLSSTTAKIQDDGASPVVLESVNPDVLPAFSVDGGKEFLNSADYLPFSTTREEITGYELPISAVPFGSLDGQDVIYSTGAIQIKNEEGNFVKATDEQLEKLFKTTIPSGAVVRLQYDENGKLSASLDDANGNTVSTLDTNQRAKETIEQIQLQGIDTIDARNNHNTIQSLVGQVVNIIGGRKIAVKNRDTERPKLSGNAPNFKKKIEDTLTSNKKSVSSTAPMVGEMPDTETFN